VQDDDGALPLGVIEDLMVGRRGEPDIARVNSVVARIGEQLDQLAGTGWRQR